MKRSRLFLKIFSVVLSIVMVLTSIVIPSFAEDAAQKDRVTFATLSGLSYVSELNRGSYNSAFLLDAKANNYQYEQLDGLLGSALASAAEKAKKDGLKYLLVNGDLTYNGEHANHLALAEKLEAFEKESGVQVIVMGSGKDINSANSSSFATGKKEYITAATARHFSSIYSELGYDIADRFFVSGGQNNAGLSYAVTLGNDYKLIVIDATYFQYQNGYTSCTGRITERLLSWIVEECEAAREAGQTVIGMCAWSLSGDSVLGSEDILVNADEVANALADAGMHYIYTAGTGKNDITAVVSDKGNVIYDVQTAGLVSFPNTYRVSTFNGETGSFRVVDVDDVKPVTAYDGEEYPQPYRETSSLQIQYDNFDLARYCSNIVKNYVSTVLIPGVNANGTLDDFARVQYGTSVTDMINEKINGGITLFGTITLFDASNIVNMLEDMFSQAQSGFLKDSDTIAQLCYNRLKTVFDAEISKVPCTAFIDSYGFGSKEHGGTIGDFLLSLAVYSKVGNEDAADDAFVQDVIKEFKSGALVKPTAKLLGTSLIRDLLFGDILSQIEMKPQYLLFFDDSEGSFGSYLQIAFRAYLALHGENASVTGAVNSILKDGFLKDYGKSIDDVIDYYIELYYSGDNAVVVGNQIADILSAYVEDTDPQKRGDYDVTYDGNAGSESYATKENYRLPSLISITPGSDTCTEAYITWYTKSTVTGSDIEIYDDENSDFYGKHFIGVDGVSSAFENSDIERQFVALDLGFMQLGETTVQLTKHTVKLSGLENGKTYYFRVGDSSKNWWSETSRLTTAADSETLSFIHVTDTTGKTQNDFSIFNNILGCADYLYPDYNFLLHTGNYVENVSDLKQWSALLDGSANSFTSHYIVPVAGSDDTVDSIKNNFAIGAILGNADRKGVYYSFDYNIAHIVVLDSNYINDDGTLQEEQLEWFKKDMQKSNAKWNIVAIHDPIYTQGSSSQRDIYTLYMKAMSALMDEYHIDIVFTGNDGVYYRTDSMRNGAVTGGPTVAMPHALKSTLYGTIPDPAGTVYSALGSSGVISQDKHEVNNVSKIFPSSGKNLNPSEAMFTAVEIYGDSLYLTSYTVRGNSASVVDKVSVKKGATDFGDVNFDGKITAADARIILRAAARLELLTAVQYAVADINGDGKITATDARKVLRISAKLE